MENRLTFGQMDALEAERKAKIADVTDKLEKVLRETFDAEELRLIWTHNAPSLTIVREAIRRVRW